MQFEVGSIVACTLGRKATIIEHRNHLEYYVNYENYDRRLDEWINATDIESLLVPAPTDPIMSQPLADTQSEEPAPGTDIGHGLRSKSASQIFTQPTDLVAEYAELEKDRQESTRVRNIDSILLGKFRIGVWYVSCFFNMQGISRRIRIPFITSRCY
jgi:hypothetical protein